MLSPRRQARAGLSRLGQGAASPPDGALAGRPPWPIQTDGALSSAPGLAEASTWTTSQDASGGEASPWGTVEARSARGLGLASAISAGGLVETQFQGRVPGSMMRALPLLCWCTDGASDTGVGYTPTHDESHWPGFAIASPCKGVSRRLGHVSAAAIRRPSGVQSSSDNRPQSTP